METRKEVDLPGKAAAVDSSLCQKILSSLTLKINAIVQLYIYIYIYIYFFPGSMPVEEFLKETKEFVQSEQFLW